MLVTSSKLVSSFIRIGLEALSLNVMNLVKKFLNRQNNQEATHYGGWYLTLDVFRSDNGFPASRIEYFLHIFIFNDLYSLFIFDINIEAILLLHP